MIVVCNCSPSFSEKEVSLKRFYDKSTFPKARAVDVDFLASMGSIVMFLGLFGVVVHLACYHTLALLALFSAYAGFFMYIKVC